ncbi:MAG: hypothetical protein E7167_04940 [Firmicutes bacterium]|nr:hypothetical protein [Bacillota bacterium]
MKFYNALSEFLYDKNYFITIFEDKLHVYRYNQLIKLSSKEIILSLTAFQLVISGRDLIISQMNNEELIIQGNITDVRKIYE